LHVRWSSLAYYLLQFRACGHALARSDFIIPYRFFQKLPAALSKAIKVLLAVQLAPVARV